MELLAAMDFSDLTEKIIENARNISNAQKHLTGQPGIEIPQHNRQVELSIYPI